MSSVCLYNLKALICVGLYHYIQSLLVCAPHAAIEMLLQFVCIRLSDYSNIT